MYIVVQNLMFQFWVWPGGWWMLRESWGTAWVQCQMWFSMWLTNTSYVSIIGATWMIMTENPYNRDTVRAWDSGTMHLDAQSSVVNFLCMKQRVRTSSRCLNWEYSGVISFHSWPMPLVYDNSLLSNLRPLFGRLMRGRNSIQCYFGLRA